MPVTFVPSWLYRCALTGTEVVSEVQALPDRWVQIGAEVYCPQALGIIAHRVLSHPDASYEGIAYAAYPDATLDDWESP